MRVAGIRELKAHLSLYLREVQAGETILVTDRGQVVAELRAPGASPELLDPGEARYRSAVARGLLRPPLTPPGAAPPLWKDFKPLRLPKGTAAELLAAERAEKDW